MQRIYIDIHTHQDYSQREGILSVLNIRLQQPLPAIPETALFMIGLHPWDTESSTLDLDFLKTVSSQSNCFGIGECGIDRLRGSNIDYQISVFEQQAKLAESLDKPLIIHCVRAWLEIIEIKSKINATVPWIIHGFRGKARTAYELLNKGFYLSFGESILSMNAVLTEIVRNTPDNRLFLETDEGKHDIEEIYHAASVIKNIPLEKLQDIIISNFNAIIGTDLPS